jgi:hypothetical protein
MAMGALVWGPAITLRDFSNEQGVLGSLIPKNAGVIDRVNP